MRRLILILIFICSVNSSVFSASYHSRVDYSDRVPLGMTVSGKIKILNAYPGQHVNKGQLLIALDSTPFKARINKHEAELKHAKTVKHIAQRDLQHAQELYDRAALSAVSLEDAKIQLLQADALIDKVNAELKIARYELSQSKIHAPFDGIILSVHINKHQTTINQLQAQPLVTLVSPHNYIVRVRVPFATAKNLHRHDKVQIQVAETGLTGSISSISSIVFNNKFSDSETDPYCDVSVEFTSDNSTMMVGENATLVFKE